MKRSTLTFLALALLFVLTLAGCGSIGADDAVGRSSPYPYPGTRNGTVDLYEDGAATPTVAGAPASGTIAADGAMILIATPTPDRTDEITGTVFPDGGISRLRVRTTGPQGVETEVDGTGRVSLSGDARVVEATISLGTGASVITSRYVATLP